MVYLKGWATMPTLFLCAVILPPVHTAAFQGLAIPCSADSELFRH